MSKILKDRHLLQRKLPSGSVKYYARVRIPKELLGFYGGKKEIKKSLKTSDKRTALVRLPEVVAEFHFEFDLKRKQSVGKITEGLDKGQARRLVQVWFREELKESNDIELEVLKDQEEIDEAIENLTDDARSLYRTNEEWLPSIQQTVNRLLMDSHIALDTDNKIYWLLCDYVRRGMLERTKRTLAAYNGTFGKKFDPLFDASAHDENYTSGSSATGLTVNEFIDLFNQATNSKRTTKKQLEYGMVYRLMSSYWGDMTLLKDINRADVRRIKDTLEHLPPNSTKRFPNKPFDEIVELAKNNSLAPLSPTTANGILQKLSTMFKWAVEEEYVDSNPAINMSVDHPVEDKAKARLSFSDEQLKLIFSPLHYSKLSASKKKTNRERYWVPLIALFSGMRMNEICQLDVSDIRELDGTFYFAVQNEGDESGKKIKSKAGVRNVPIHSKLKKLGLLDYWIEWKKAGDRKLFPDLKPDSRGYFSGNFQKWFGRYLVTCGAKAPRTSFHSFRHRFRDALRDANVSVELTERICGWSGAGIQSRYGSGPHIGALGNSIDKIEFPNLDLSYLDKAQK